jgi:hypothetical protein
MTRLDRQGAFAGILAATRDDRVAGPSPAMGTSLHASPASGREAFPARPDQGRDLDGERGVAMSRELNNPVVDTRSAVQQ